MDETRTREILSEYKDLEKLKAFPRPGSKVILESHDGTKTIATFIQPVTVRTKAVGDLFMFQRCGDYDKAYIEYLAGELRFRRSQGYDNTIMITGEVRTGKSVMAQHIALAMDPNLTLDKITFKLEDFNKGISTAKDGDIIIMDEAGVDLYSKEWWNEFQIELNKKLFIIGMLHLTLILVLPHRMHLNKDIREGRMHYWINVKNQRGSLERGFASIREYVPNEWYLEPFWDTMATFHFPVITGPFYESYLKKKADFVWEMNNTDYMSRTSSKKNAQRNKAIRMLLKQGLTQQAIADELGLDRTIISDIKNGVQV